MTAGVSAEPRRAPPPPSGPPRVTPRSVAARRLLGVTLAVGPLVWATHRALSGGTEIVNTGGLSVLGGLLDALAHPALSPEFLQVVWRATVSTVVFAVLGTVGALVIGAVGGLVLSDAAWGPRPPLVLRGVRTGLRGVLVAVRSVHELIWALLLVSVLGLDPLVAVIAIALPFGAQTAKVVGDILDGVPRGPTRALQAGGVRPFVALSYGVLPPASPLLVSYSFYRFECSIRSAVILGVVGVGGLGSELVTSLRSRNWDEVWTLVAAVVVLCAVVEWWSSRVRGDLAVATCSDWAATDGGPSGRPRRRRSTRVTLVAALVLVVASWFASGVSLAGLFSSRTRDRVPLLLDDMWPPALPPGGWPEVLGGTLDTLAMALLATAIAVAITLALGPFATRLRPVRGSEPSAPVRHLRRTARALSGLALLVLRSVPPTVWAAIVLLVLFPGVLPGALALGLYTGGILGRLVAEAWDGIDLRPRDALRSAGVAPTTAALASVVPPSSQHLVTYTLYRFEICVRDTAIVGVVGAAGLGRLLAENLAVFRYDAVTTLLAASFAVSVAAEVAGRRVRRMLLVRA
jgi:phosphonate transport system permease protein